MSEGRYAEAIAHFEAARSFLEVRKLDSGIARFAKERIAVREGECRAAIGTQDLFYVEAAVRHLPDDRSSRRLSSSVRAWNGRPGS